MFGLMKIAVRHPTVSQFGSVRQVYVFSPSFAVSKRVSRFCEDFMPHAQSSEDNTKRHLTRDYNLLTPYRAKLDGASLEF